MARANAWLVALVALLLSCGGPSKGGPGAVGGSVGGTGLIISGLYLNSSSGAGAVAIRVANPTSAAVNLAGCSLTDELGTRSKRLRERGDRGRRDLFFPTDTRATVVAPGQEVWVARDAAAFAVEFGAPPDFEVNEDSAFPANDKDVPDVRYQGPASKRGSWLTLSRSGSAIVALVDAEDDDRFLSVVPYNMGGKKAKADRPSQDKIRQAEAGMNLAAGALWRGEPLMKSKNLFLPSPPISARNRLFLRDRDADDKLVPDTRTFADWDAASSYTGLGKTANHRLWYPGQSNLRFVRHDEAAVVTMTAAPESNSAATIAAFDAAKHDIKVHMYYFSSPKIADALVRAVKRGVNVSLALEGGVVGVKHGFSDKTRLIAKRIEEAGRDRSKNAAHGFGRVYWIRSDRKAGIDDRYSYDHSKYAILDGRGLIIGSENYGSTGHPVSNTYGNRGWEIQLKTPRGKPALGIVKDLIRVWKADVDPKRFHDYVRYSDDPATLDSEGRGRYGPPPPGLKAKSDLKYGRYVPRDPPQETVTETVGAELVMSPDNSLSERGAILGAIAAARHTLLVEHMSLATQWGGKRSGSPEKTPNVLLQACIEAARRGVKVRILLSCRGFGCDRLDASWEGNKIDNDDTHELVHKLARKEKLDMQVRLLDTTSDEWLDDPESHGNQKIHNKGMIVDGRVTLFSSINGVENSFKANRETGVLVTSKRVAQFYEQLFWYDWTTVMGPRGLQAETASDKEALAALNQSPTRASVQLTGLKPSTRYFLRVSAVDSDATDVETSAPPKALSPHESGLSEELAVDSSPEGTLLLSWPRNRSECLEGDLAGYKVYYDTRPGAIGSGGLVAPDDVRKFGLYQGKGAREGASPIAVAAHEDQPQCKGLREIQATRDPMTKQACVDLLDHVGACVGKAGDVFVELDHALKPHMPVGSPQWQRRKDTLVRGCSGHDMDTAQYWQAEQEQCATLTACGELYMCLRRIEVRHYRGFLKR